MGQKDEKTSEQQMMMATDLSPFAINNKEARRIKVAAGVLQQCCVKGSKQAFCEAA
jgi:hypothetical protein